MNTTTRQGRPSATVARAATSWLVDRTHGDACALHLARRAVRGDVVARREVRRMGAWERS